MVSFGVLVPAQRRKPGEYGSYGRRAPGSASFSDRDKRHTTHAETKPTMAVSTANLVRMSRATILTLYHSVYSCAFWQGKNEEIDEWRNRKTRDTRREER